MKTGLPAVFPSRYFAVATISAVPERHPGMTLHGRLVAQFDEQRIENPRRVRLQPGRFYLTAVPVNAARKLTHLSVGGPVLYWR
ncbi:hypothetical protein [Burkholderia perseverans]|uniref:hypothetical protein n=1 Tax=Burkholderia perseverans TaxID=2615214 RepID=UPI001FF04892|nr:hypothetical protein [Burkholderia perseverans]